MTRRIPAYFIALALLFTTGWTYKIERPDDYPFTGNLEKREAWQEKALRHARSDLKDIKGGTVLLVADQKLATDAAESEVQQWIVVVKRELGETRTTLKAAVQTPTSFESGGGSSFIGGPCSYGPSTNAYVNPCGCESSTPQVVSPSGQYWGKYQFDYQTWVAHGGNPSTYGSASVAEQDAVASRLTYDGWPNC